MPNEKQGCLGFILKLLGIDPRSSVDESGPVDQPLPYRQCDNFLSPAELAFFQVLHSAASSHFYVCTKVRISDLVYVVNRRNNMGHANRIDRKHVDFVLCDPTTMTPKLVVELDDSSHQRKDRRERDELVDSVFEAAGLPILHVPWSRSYDREQLKQSIRDSLGLPSKGSAGVVEAPLAPPDSEPTVGTNITSVPPEAEATASRPIEGTVKQQGSEIPSCPKCSAQMVMKKASKGAHEGKRFWACSSYPKCRKIIAID